MVNYTNLARICSVHLYSIEDVIKMVYDTLVNINDNFERGEEFMKKQVLKSTAKGMKTVLNAALRSEANSASCIIMYQPRAPKELARFRRNK